MIGREQDLEPINRRALEIAKAVATETGALFAGDICNTNVYDPADPASHKAVRAMFEEQVGWAVDAGVDFIVGETFSWAQEALIALDVIKQAKQTGGDHARDAQGRRHARGLDRRRRLPSASPMPAPTSSGSTASAAPRRCCRCCARSAPRVKTHAGGAAGAVSHERERAVVPVAARHALALRRRQRGRFPSRSIRSPATASRSPSSGADAIALDIRYLGVCCGAGPHHIRALAEAVGKQPPASKYSPDMSKHAFLGSHERIKQVQKDYANKL